MKTRILILSMVGKYFPRLANAFFIKLFFRAIKHPMPKREKPMHQQAVRWVTSIHGKQVQGYRWEGGERRAFFLHGWSGRAAQGFAIVEALQQHGFSVESVDLPGHGLSEGKSSNLHEGRLLLEKIIMERGAYDLVIGHSFGGVIAAYAQYNGVDLSHWVSIGSPVSSQYIIDSFREAVGAPLSFDQAMYDYITDQFGLDFREYGIEDMLEKLDRKNILMIHDRLDKEVDYTYTAALKKRYPDLHIHITEGLGHKRILFDSDTVGYIVAFAEKKIKPVKV